ncbi:flagellar basal body protein [Melaminivora alkalimesophila]|uniref:Flagellar basal body rod protein n=1 Tax=Melaminivora alkalimesophila TaxID=1165852 RepID=A0A317RBE5_9BURK|nr:flagellar basal body protein [Melaminivora alkalimesophila]PWW46812.1 flagellar basal body rod protein [Melaminivora alkalimesophila]
MSSLGPIASSGLQAAQLRLAASAHNIANADTPGFRRHAVAQQALPERGGVQARVGEAAAPGVALEAEAVEQIAAAYAFKANVLVLRTAQDMAGTLLDVRA